MWKVCCYFFVLLFFVSGCQPNSKYSSYLDSVTRRNYSQAAIRLERCAGRPMGRDPELCEDLITRFNKTGLSLEEAIRLEYERELEERARQEEQSRIAGLRASRDPWDKLILAVDIQAGIVKAEYTGEDADLIQKAFFGFGKCAKQGKPACMTQYAQMILYGTGELTSEEKESAKEKVKYWLTLAARYGDQIARKLLISIEEEIPTPDLSMEQLQKDANTIARRYAEERIIMEKKQAYYNERMLNEVERTNFINSMNTFFPKTVNCTSQSIGGTTYTNCY